jgi:hypothetical protein
MTEKTETKVTTDPRVLAAAKALREHFAAEDSMVNDFPADEYICCAEIALKAADEAGKTEA